LATWAALPTSVWMRMYAVTTSTDLLAVAEPPLAGVGSQRGYGSQRAGRSTAKTWSACYTSS
jgi:hypothetical protein